MGQIKRKYWSVITRNQKKPPKIKIELGTHLAPTNVCTRQEEELALNIIATARLTRFHHLPFVQRMNTIATVMGYAHYATIPRGTRRFISIFYADLRRWKKFQSEQKRQQGIEDGRTVPF